MRPSFRADDDWSKRVLNSVTSNAQVQLQAYPSIARVALPRNALVSCSASFGNSGAEAAARRGFGMIASGLAARTPAGAGRGAALHSLSPV